jgi:hypothetical protein
VDSIYLGAAVVVLFAFALTLRLQLITQRETVTT